MLTYSMFRLFANIWQSREQPLPKSSSSEKADSTRSLANTSTDAHTAVENALLELDASIQGLEKALSTAEHDKQHIATTLAEYHQHAQTLHSEAKAALHAGNEAAARELLLEQQGMAGMVKEYERMLGNISVTVRKVQEQRRFMLIQRDEIKAQRTIIEAQLHSAKSHEEFMKNLHSLGISYEHLEEELTLAHVRMSLENIPHENPTKSDEYLLTSAMEHASIETSAVEVLASLNAELEAEHRMKSQLEADALQKRFSLAFHGQKSASNLAPQPSSEEPSKEQILKNFFNQY
jgi:phage shock protein A